MLIADQWKDYHLIATSGGDKLERWGKVVTVRPDPQVIWKNPRSSAWDRADAVYRRSSSGGGHWDYKRRLPESWQISYENLTFKISPTGFKHTGLFPEQAVNWDRFGKAIREAGRPIKVLNLFAYTGGATLACAAAGAKVTHVDAAKGMVQWAGENAKLSGLADRPIRWIIDDCEKFVRREIRRENFYDAVILDPPSYGRGPGGEVWKLENAIYDLCVLIAQVLSDRPLFVALNSYTTGLNPGTMGHLLSVTMPAGLTRADEIGLREEETGLCLPAGSTALWRAAE